MRLQLDPLAPNGISIVQEQKTARSGAGYVGTGVREIVAGTNITVNNSNPQRPIVSASGGSGSGSVTSVDVSGGTTGLTTSGGPVTGSGTITLGGTLAAANGGNLFDLDTNTPLGTPLNNVYRIRHSFNNFLSNASFEYWLNGTSVAPNAWTLNGDVTIARSATATIDTYSAQLTFGTANTGEFYQDIGVSTSVDYTFSAYVQRISGTGGARLVAQQEGSPFTEFASVGLPTASGWQLITLSVKPSAGTQLRFSIKSSNGVASTWLIDEAMAQESKNVATAYLPKYIDDMSNNTLYGLTTFLGGITTSTFKLTASPTNGYILTSDASGNASWQANTAITRNVTTTSTNVSAGSTANTDYVIIVTSGSPTITLPTAVNNNNNYTVINSGTGIPTVNTTSSQTINGSLTATLPIQNMSLDFISDNANWHVE